VHFGRFQKTRFFRLFCEISRKISEKIKKSFFEKKFFFGKFFYEKEDGSVEMRGGIMFKSDITRLSSHLKKNFELTSMCPSMTE